MTQVILDQLEILDFKNEIGAEIEKIDSCENLFSDIDLNCEILEI